VPVIVALLEGEKLERGQSAYVQLRSAEPFVACPGDRFVLRAYSPAHTVGGGKILDPSPVRHKGVRPEVVATLSILDKGEAPERLAAFLRLRAGAGLVPSEAQALLNVTLEQARNLLQAAVRAGTALVADRKAQRHVAAALVRELSDNALEILTRFHAENPLKKGLGVEELRTKFPLHVDARLVAFTLEEMAREGRVAMDGDTVRSSAFKAALSLSDETLRNDILAAIRRRGFEAPTAAEVAGELGREGTSLRPVMDFLFTEGVLVRTKEGFYFDAGMMADLVERTITLLASKGEIGVGDIKDLTNATRKYAIPLLEFLDSRKVTLRKGDVRVAGPKGKRT
jgi:selenocysteine-specific elongation factor